MKSYLGILGLLALSLTFAPGFAHAQFNPDQDDPIERLPLPETKPEAPKPEGPSDKERCIEAYEVYDILQTDGISTRDDVRICTKLGLFIAEYCSEQEMTPARCAEIVGECGGDRLDALLICGNSRLS